ncbi:hypothetical protein M2155_000614 [Streptomyces sp. SAI-119]|uniref:hypothetical protein n=1 Tax=Streptomyces sp. SAI-119 TaxID=2940541 RepID=UPI002475AC02|nr:hypothetical protein [Streptomyces sp. SAI-119]MDH6448206.1 hypothetical protein [Streptomyces sp. SAI-119]
MGLLRETRADDNDRTGRMLDAVDRAFDGRIADRDEDFVTALVNGLGTDKAAEVAGNYPPAGHGYPRRRN